MAEKQYGRANARLRRWMLVLVGLMVIAMFVLLARPRTPPVALPTPEAGQRPEVSAVASAVDPQPRDSEAAPANPSAAPLPRTDSPPRPGTVLLDEARLLRDAEYRQAEFAQVRSRMPSDFPGLVEELGLSPGQAGQLFDFLTEVQLQKRAVNVPIVVGEAPDVAAVEAMASRRQEIQRQRNEALVTVLGPGGAARFMQYEEERPARFRVNDLQRQLESAGEPLAQTQMRPLIAAYSAFLKREREQVRPEQSVDPARMAVAAQPSQQDVEQRAASNRRLLAAMTPHLSASQLAALAASLDQSLARDRAMLRINSERTPGE